MSEIVNWKPPLEKRDANCRHCQNFEEDPRADMGPVGAPVFSWFCLVMGLIMFGVFFRNGWSGYVWMASGTDMPASLFYGIPCLILLLFVVPLYFIGIWIKRSFIGRKERRGLDRDGLYHRHDGGKPIEHMAIEFVLEVSTFQAHRLISNLALQHTGYVSTWRILAFDFATDCVTLERSSAGKSREEVMMPTWHALRMASQIKGPLWLLNDEVRERHEVDKRVKAAEEAQARDNDLMLSVVAVLLALRQFCDKDGPLGRFARGEYARSMYLLVTAAITACVPHEIIVAAQVRVDEQVPKIIEKLRVLSPKHVPEAPVTSPS